MNHISRTVSDLEDYEEAERIAAKIHALAAANVRAFFLRKMSRLLGFAEAMPKPMSRRRRAALAFLYRYLQTCIRGAEHIYIDQSVQRARHAYIAARLRDTFEARPIRVANIVAIRFARRQRDELDACRIGCQNESRQACIKRLVSAEHSHLQILRTLMSPELRP